MSQLVRVSVRSRSGVVHGEDLRDRAAGVVGDQVEFAEFQRLAEVFEQPGQPVQAEVLFG